MQSIQDTSAGDKRKEGQPSSSSRKKHKTSIPRGFQGQGHDYQGQVQIMDPSQLQPMTCYHYHQPGHMRRDCPHRQRSQNYEAPQSQSLVRHTQTCSFLLTPARSRGTSISLRVQHKHLPCHRQARESRVWVEVGDMAYKPGLWGPRGLSTQLRRRLRLQIIWLYMVYFYYRAYGQVYCLIPVHLIHLLLHLMWMF